MAPSPRIAVLGGGISGLAAAWELSRLLPQADIHLLESGRRLGGVIRTTHDQGFTLEHSADMFTTEPDDAWQLCRELGLEDQLLTTRETPQRAWVASESGIHPVPAGFSLMLPGNVEAVLQSPLLSESGKARFLEEEQVPPGPADQDSSLAEFVTRRFGEEVFQRLVQPLASGIYTGDPHRLSMQATMQRFLRLEQTYGSLIRAAREGASASGNRQTDAQTSGARYGLFRAPRLGMGQLVDALVGALAGVQIRLGAVAGKLTFAAGTWQLEMREGPQESPAVEIFDAVIAATPAPVTGNLLQQQAPGLSRLLKSVEAASAAILLLSLPRSGLESRFDGYGIIVPAMLGRRLIACSFTSNKFEHRAAPDQQLVRCFVGGALQPELVDLDDDSLEQLAIEELGQLLPLRQRPRLLHIVRWRHCMPQYTLGHLRKLEQIEGELEALPGLWLAGNSYRGVGIPACIASGRQAARQAVTMLER